MPGAVKKVAAGDCGIHRRGWMHTLCESWRKAQEKIQLFRISIQMKDVTDIKDTMFLYWQFFNDKLLKEQCLNDVNGFDQLSKVKNVYLDTEIGQN